MGPRSLVLGLGAAGLLAVSVLPATAQVDDFLCSTFNYKCQRPPVPPPPALAPEQPPPATTKPAHHAHKAKAKAKAKAQPKHTPAPKADGGAPAAPEAK